MDWWIGDCIEKLFDLANDRVTAHFASMTDEEIKAHLAKLSRAEIEEIRVWIDDFLEDQLELADDVKNKLDQSRREIAEGNYSTKRDQRWIDEALASGPETPLTKKELDAIRNRTFCGC
jgi:hypothetical protein